MISATALTLFSPVSPVYSFLLSAERGESTGRATERRELPNRRGVTSSPLPSRSAGRRPRPSDGERERRGRRRGSGTRAIAAERNETGTRSCTPRCTLRSREAESSRGSSRARPFSEFDERSLVNYICAERKRRDREGLGLSPRLTIVPGVFGGLH